MNTGGYKTVKFSHIHIVFPQVWKGSLERIYWLKGFELSNTFILPVLEEKIFE